MGQTRVDSFPNGRYLLWRPEAMLPTRKGDVRLATKLTRIMLACQKVSSANNVKAATFGLCAAVLFIRMQLANQLHTVYSREGSSSRLDVVFQRKVCLLGRFDTRSSLRS